MATTTLKFDNLNVLNGKNVKKSKKALAIPYYRYFGEMFITPEQKYQRIELARQIESVMLYVFAYWAIRTAEELPTDDVRQEAKKRLTNVIAKHSKIDPYLEEHIDSVIDEVMDATERHAEDDDDTESDYWTSRERAMIIAENEANALYNYEDYKKAKSEGKTKKTWITELDDKVRLTHTLVEGKTVDIDGLFLVGDSLMRFPKDTMYEPAASELVNCRCSIEYK